jgi:cytochrome c-type biogenesis protein CcmH/NrfG
MKEEAVLVLSALIDGEEVTDLALLAEALDDPAGREALVEFARLRSTVRADGSQPSPAFYREALQAREPSKVWSPPRALRRLAAAVVLILASGGLVDLGLYLRGRGPEQPPHPTRVFRFEPGVDWHASTK